LGCRGRSAAGNSRHCRARQRASERRCRASVAGRGFVRAQRGGVGNSTLAIETAVHLVKDKSTAGAKVALVDLDFQSSHICDYRDIAPKFQFDEIVAAPERLDDQLLSAFISRHSSGLDVFAASRSRFHTRDLDVEALSALFDRMAHRYGYIIIDLPLSVHSWTIPLLAASKGILVTGLNTIPGLRQIEETLRALRAEARITADVRAVVNRCGFGPWASWTEPTMWRGFLAAKSASSSETPASRSNA
jgi:Flp pilus assembly CpaE family ATPase